jgi:hypothetical protein
MEILTNKTKKNHWITLNRSNYSCEANCVLKIFFWLEKYFFLISTNQNYQKILK